MRLYELLRRFLRFVAEVFFRQVEVVGQEHVPGEGEGPVVFAGNHPNSLIDPVLIIAFSGRVVHFAAKDVLFKSALLRTMLSGLGAVPVARKADHGDGASNDQAFAALHDVLRAGRAMGIFPEGCSHDEAHLVRLKTGAARIALGAAAELPEGAPPIRIVPCGLTYVRRKRFRSRALLQFGPPIVIDATWLAGWRDDERNTVRRLTDTIDDAIRALTVNAEDWTTLRVLDGVRRLYQPSGIRIEERVELARRFSTVYPTVKDAPEVRQLWDRVSSYQTRLEDVGLTDAELLRPRHALHGLWRLLRHVLLALVWFPLAVPGLIIHAPVGILATIAGATLTPRKDVLATTKLVVGLLGALVLDLALVVLAGWTAGPLGVLAALVLLPLTGLATLRVVDRFGAIRRWGRILGRLWRLPDEVAALRQERAALEQEVVRAVDRFKPADMVALVPREARAP